MNRKSVARALKVFPFLAGAAVFGAVTIASMPVVTSAQNGAIAPTPAPAGRTGGPIDVTVDYANALAAWQPPVARAAQLAVTGDSNSGVNAMTVENTVSSRNRLANLSSSTRSP